MSKASRTAQPTQYSFGTSGVQMDIESPDSHLEEAADRAMAILVAATNLEIVRLVQDERNKWQRGKSEIVVESSFQLGSRKYIVEHSFDLTLKVTQEALEQQIATRVLPVVYRALGSYIGDGRYGIMPIPSLDVMATEFANAVESFVQQSAEITTTRR